MMGCARNALGIALLPIALLKFFILLFTVNETRAYVTFFHTGNSVIGARFQRAKQSTSKSISVLRAFDSDGRNYEDDNDDDDDDDDDIQIDDSSLGDWRKFRASLIDGGLTSTDETSGEQTNKPKKRQPVAKQNELLLEKQSAKLAEEYRSGVWAHIIGEPEVGGLLCRMPIEAEIYYGTDGHWKDKIKLMMTLNDESSTGKTRDILDEETDRLADTRVNEWFKMAERMVSRELQDINNSGKIKNGILNPNDLEENSRFILDRYMNYQQTWQEVCLVLSHKPESGRSEALVINRPITKNINRQLAQILLTGNTVDGNKGDGQKFGYDFEYGLEDKMVQAFGREAAVYMGGPDKQSEPATLIHGIPNLDGATEIAPGTGIYQGGVSAAVDGILNGLYQPLDFRFFLGRQVYDPKSFPDKGTLLQKVEQASYQPIACARSVALKQCLGLPKPLWHEVLELCGGEMKSISSIELKKRIDLQQ